MSTPVAAGDMQTLPVGTLIQNAAGEYGMITDRDESGNRFSEKKVLRLTKKQAKRLMKWMDKNGMAVKP
jgi:hypothetical protein